MALPAFVLFVWFTGGPDRIHPTIVSSLSHGVSADNRGTLADSTALAPLPQPSCRPNCLSGPVLLRTILLVVGADPRLRLFFPGPAAGFYFPLVLRDPAYVDKVAPNDYSRPDQVQNVIVSLERTRTKFVVWSAWLNEPQSVHDPRYHLAPLRTYLRNHYHIVTSFSGSEQVWERTPDPAN